MKIIPIIFISAVFGHQSSEAEHRRDFLSFDENRDNFVDAFEVRKQFPSVTAEDLSAFFIAADKNEDGLISFDEYMKASLSHDEGALSLNDYKVY